MESSNKNRDAKVDEQNIILHHELNDLREKQAETNTKLEDAQRQVEQRRPLANGVTSLEIAAALLHDIDLTLDLIVVSKARKTLGQHISLLSFALKPNNANLYARSCLNALMTLRDQADHSINGSCSKLGEIPLPIINMVKGQ